MKRFVRFERCNVRHLLAWTLSVMFVLVSLSAIQLSVPANAADPVWKGTVKTDESQTSTSSDGLRTSILTQRTTYVLNGQDSSFSSTFDDHFSHNDAPCGPMQDDYTGVGAGPYPDLSMYIGGPDANGVPSAELSTGGAHFHTGTQITQTCFINGPIHQVETTSSSRTVAVYGPRGIGCAETRFAVPYDIQAIRGTVTKSCSSGDFDFTSTWTYAVKLDPCNPAIDSDGGGEGDCAEFDAGRDPQNPADDFKQVVDTDDDGVADASDNCPSTYNPNQADLDSDRTGDVCDPDIDADGQGNGSDPCPLDPLNTCDDPLPLFSCASPDAQSKVYIPTYSAKVKMPGIFPDLKLFRFEPRIVACWNGASSAWKQGGSGVYGFVDSGVDEAVLDILGFEPEYDPTRNYVTVSGTQAEVSANFNFDFAILKLFDKFGVKKAVQGKVEKKVAKNLGKWLKKHEPDSRLFGLVVRKEIKRIMKEYTKAAEKFRRFMKSRHVPKKLADPIADWVEKQIQQIADDANEAGMALTNTNSFRKLTADKMAEKLVGTVFDAIDPHVKMLVWQPNYVYLLSANGAITRTNGPNAFENPFLTVTSKD